MARSRSGMGLLEVLVAFVILGLALFPIIGLFSSTGEQTRQSSDQALALTVCQKVSEELEVANWENVHLDRELAETLADPGAQAVVDGRSPFFRAIEDQAEPSGRIRPGEDPGITPAYRTLHQEYQGFELGARASSRPLPTTGTLLDVHLDLTWPDFRQRRSGLRLGVPLGRHESHPPLPTGLEDQTNTDERIAALLFPTRTGKTLSRIAQDLTTDVAQIRDLGHILLVLNPLLETQVADAAETAALEQEVAGASGELPRARSLLRLGRHREARAAGILAACAFATAPLDALARTLTPASLARWGVPAALVVRALTGLQALPLYLDEELIGSRSAYLRAHDPPTGEVLPSRVRIRLFMKILDISKIRALHGAPGELAFITPMLERFRDAMDGRNPNFRSFARLELQDVTSLETLRSSSPTWRREGLERFQEATRTFAVRMGARPDPGPGRPGDPSPPPPAPVSR